MAVGAAVALHAHRAHVGEQHDRALPDLGIKARGRQLVAHDGVSLTQQLKPLLRHLTDDANAEARPREGLAGDDRLGQPELAANGAHLVLEQGAQRLDELELEVVGQAAHVVVALDVRGARAATRLDDVGVERALHEELHGLAFTLRLEHERLGGRLERANEFAADDLALLLGVGDARERIQELLTGIHRHEADARGSHIVFFDLAALIGPQEAVVDEDADQLVADGLVHDCRGDRAVDAAGQSADDARAADLSANALDLLGDDAAAVPVGGDAGGAVQEVLEHPLPEL